MGVYKLWLQPHLSWWNDIMLMFLLYCIFHHGNKVLFYSILFSSILPVLNNLVPKLTMNPMCNISKTYAFVKKIHMCTFIAYLAELHACTLPKRGTFLEKRLIHPRMRFIFGDYSYSISLLGLNVGWLARFMVFYVLYALFCLMSILVNLWWHLWILKKLAAWAYLNIIGW